MKRLTALMSALILLCCSAACAEGDYESLCALAAPYGFRLGSCLSYNQLMNGYIIGIEIMQGIAGSLGVVLTVPLTAAVSSFLIARKAEKSDGANAADGLAAADEQ